MVQTEGIDSATYLRNLVVGIDDSPTSQAALEWAVAVVGSTGHVEAVHAVTAASDIISAIVSLDPDALANEARGRLEGEWTEAARKTGAQLSTSLEFDQPAAALIARAASAGAGAIVVGAHGTGRWSQHYLGSTASKLLHSAEIPVIVVQGSHSGASGAVVVGYDGSPTSRKAIMWAAEVATERDLPLEVLTAVPPAEYSAADLFADLDLGKYHDQIAAQVHEHIEAMLPDAPIAVSETVVLGDPLRTLVDASDRAWLLVVGRPLSSRLDEYITGSTARHLAAAGHCPVAIVPGPGQGD